MNTLTRIFETKRQEVADSKAAVPLGLVRRQAAEADPPRGFLNALKAAGRPLALIAEIKKASPSRGLIRKDFEPVLLARQYEAAGANALSVLTDSRYFMGSLENLRLARDATGLPCLRKDFVFDPYQVFEARAFGADAILLIVGALEDSQLVDLMALAAGMGMDALVEVHDEREAERAIRAEAPLVGVNNRSLADFSVNLATGERILPMVSGAFAVAESALERREDLDRMWTAGARAVLIGTAFCSAPDVAIKVGEVMGW